MDGCFGDSLSGMANEAPQPEEIGRYRVYRNNDGSLSIPRAAPLCERCETCGCGEAQTQLEVPAWAATLVPAIMSGTPVDMDSLPGPLRMLAKARMGR
jgi:hypothetical protein